MNRAPRNSRHRPALAMAVIAALTAALAACGSSGGDSVSPTASPSATMGGTRTVVDNAGRSVQIPADITRVATNLPALPPAIYLLGQMSKLVATTPVGISSFLGTTVDPAAKSIPTNAFPSTSTVNEEALLAARPQVVLTSQFQTALLPTFARLGIPALVFGNSAAPDSPTALEGQMSLLAQVFGGDAVDRAQRWDSYFNTNLAMITAKTTSIPMPQRPTVYYSASTPTTTDPLASWIEEAGGQNLSAENGVTQGKSFAFPTITVETLLKWNPQIIITQQAATAKQFQTQPQYATLPAVQNHHVYANPYGIWPWSTGVAEQPLEPLWIAKTLYPTQFTNLDLVNATKTFYSDFYFYQLSDQQATAIVNATLGQ